MAQDPGLSVLDAPLMMDVTRIFCIQGSVKELGVICPCPYSGFMLKRVNKIYPLHH